MHERKIKATQSAVEEARRFIKRALEHLKILENDEFLHGSPEQAAARRSSLDLSKELAKWRKV